MRGKAYRTVPNIENLGITPAYAGKSHTYCYGDCMARDHPRVCGEKGQGAGEATDHIGSPPRMRGKGQALLADNTGVGITPAYAGKSIFISLLIKFIQDHPRVCGEK